MDSNDARLALGIASSFQSDIKKLGLGYDSGIDDILEMFDKLITEAELRDTTRDLFRNKHYAQAVEEGFKCLNNFVKERSRLTIDGAKLMKQAFSPEKGCLRLNNLKTQSQKSQQQGYMDIFAGCMTGIRNPRAHEPRYTDNPKTALELLMTANHLYSIAKNSKKTRKRKK